MGYRNMGVEICGVGYGVVWDMGVWGTVVAVGTEVVTALGVSPSHCGVTHGGFRPILSCSNKRGAFLGGGGVGLWGWAEGGAMRRDWGGGARHPQPRACVGPTRNPALPPGPPPGPLCPIATP